ncbi:restriction endonuclease, partial [Cronobacter sakazakii]|nr:restriction endonuclease [Cronobacter sakazakii]
MARKVSELSPSEFENLIFDLVSALGMKNAVWRTPGRDGGRDIEGEWFITDLSGFSSRQIWHVECKRYQSSVGWPTVWEKIGFGQSNAADVLLFTVSSSMSPQAVDEINKWNKLRNKPLIRYWGGVDIENKVREQPLLAVKYGIADDPRMIVGAALLPIVNLLVKYANTAHSSEVFGFSSLSKNKVIYSFSELISARLDELNIYEKFAFSKFRASRDGLDLIENAALLDALDIDKYGMRALCFYLCDRF